MLGATLACLALVGAVVSVLGGVAGRFEPAQLLSPGLLVPLGLLALAVAAVLLVRRGFASRAVRLDGETLEIRPGILPRLIKATPSQRLALGQTQAIRLLATRDGARLALFGDEASPLLVELARPDVVDLLQATDAAPDDAWSDRARAAADELRDHGEGLLTTDHPRATGAQLAATCRAAGLWQLASDALWPTVLAHPDALDHARDLHAGERQRLPSVNRLGLLQTLLLHHEGSAELLLDYARLCMVLRNRPEAEAALDRLVALPDPPAVGVRWRTVLRKKMALPAPPSKGTLGIEVNLPSHRIDGDELVVDERWRVGLDWFVAYRLLTGFWGPPRRMQLIDIWGEKHFVLGDALDWAARLERAAPHLCEVHDEGFLWPGTGARIRQLRKLGRSGPEGR